MASIVVQKDEPSDGIQVAVLSQIDVRYWTGSTEQDARSNVMEAAARAEAVTFHFLARRTLYVRSHTLVVL